MYMTQSHLAIHTGGRQSTAIRHSDNRGWLCGPLLRNNNNEQNTIPGRISKDLLLKNIPASGLSSASQPLRLLEIHCTTCCSPKGHLCQDAPHAERKWEQQKGRGVCSVPLVCFPNCSQSDLPSQTVSLLHSNPRGLLISLRKTPSPHNGLQSPT